MRKQARRPAVEGLEHRLTLSCAGQVISAAIQQYNAVSPTPFGVLNATFARDGRAEYGAGSAEFARIDWCA